MKFSIILILSLFFFSSDHISEIATLNSEAEIKLEGNSSNNHSSAKAYYNPRPWEGGTARRLLHEFDCSVPRWRKQYPITYCSISSNIDLVLYESENYQGEYRVLSVSSSLHGFPKKFKTPGSIEVLYKGNRQCISGIGRENSNNYSSRKNHKPSFPSQPPSGSRTEKPALYYISSGTERNAGFYTYIENKHPTRAIEVKYKSYYNSHIGWSQTIKITVEAQSKKPIFLNKESETKIITANYFD